MMTELHYQIAGLRFRFFSDTPHISLVSRPENHDFCIRPLPFPDFDVEVTPGKPDILDHTQSVFIGNVSDAPGHLWRVFQAGPVFIPEVALSDGSVMRAVMQADHTQWRIYVESPPDTVSDEVDPLIYPFGHLLLYYSLSFFNGLMLHASGVYYKGGGYIFSGYSGRGKTTMANIWEREGALVVHHDTLILRWENNALYMHSMPVPALNDHPRKARVSGIFLIDHGDTNQAHKLAGVSAVAHLMVFCIQHQYHQRLVAQLLAAVNRICTALPVFDLRFLPEPDIVPFCTQLIDNDF